MARIACAGRRRVGDPSVVKCLKPIKRRRPLISRIANRVKHTLLSSTNQNVVKWKYRPPRPKVAIVSILVQIKSFRNSEMLWRAKLTGQLKSEYRLAVIDTRGVS